MKSERFVTSYLKDKMTLIIHEMLRKKGNATQQKDKATQHNSPKVVIF